MENNLIDTRIQMLEALERLEKNKDFQLVILDGYMKDEVLRINSLLANPTIKTQGKRADVMEMLVAISTFGEYMNTIKAMGATAKYQQEDPIEDDENGEF